MPNHSRHLEVSVMLREVMEKRRIALISQVPSTTCSQERKPPDTHEQKLEYALAPQTTQILRFENVYRPETSHYQQSLVAFKDGLQAHLGACEKCHLPPEVLNLLVEGLWSHPSTRCLA